MKNGKTLYFIATSVGLFATDTLLGTATNWIQLGKNTIGNVVVDMVVTRQIDGLVVVATHGNGIYSTNASSIEDILGTKEDKLFLSDNLKVFPTAASNSICIAVKNPESETAFKVYDLSGNLIEHLKPVVTINQAFFYQHNISTYKKGMYFLQMTNTKSTETITFIKQ